MGHRSSYIRHFSLIMVCCVPLAMFSQVIRRGPGGAIGDISELPFIDLKTAQVPEMVGPAGKHAAYYNQIGKAYVGAKTDEEVPNRVGRYQYGGDYDSLPTKNADLIILGTVTKETPHLSANGTSVYSIITISSQKVIKGQPISPDGFVNAERHGGVVELPSGKKRLEGIVGQGLPVPGSTYLLFLKSFDNTYSILAGYTYDSSPPKALDAADDNVQAISGDDLINKVVAKLSKP